MKSWHLRFFVLEDGVLRYFEKDLGTDEPPYGDKLKGEMRLRHCDVGETGRSGVKNLQLLIVNESGSDKNMLLQFETKNRESEWRESLSDHCRFANSKFAGGQSPKGNGDSARV